MIRLIAAVFIAACVGACGSTDESKTSDASTNPPVVESEAGADAGNTADAAPQCLPVGASCTGLKPLIDVFCCSGRCSGEVGKEACD